MERIDLLTEEEFNFSEKEEILLKCPKLYLKYIPKADKVEDFIKNELLCATHINNTYYEEEYINIQCEINCLRSLGDLFLITKRYFKSVTLKQFCHIFWLETKYSSHFCYDIKKRIYWHATNKVNISDIVIIDELGWTLRTVFNSIKNKTVD